MVLKGLRRWPAAAICHNLSQRLHQLCPTEGFTQQLNVRQRRIVRRTQIWPLISSTATVGKRRWVSLITSAPLNRPGSIRSLISSAISVEASSNCSACSPFPASGLTSRADEAVHKGSGAHRPHPRAPAPAAHRSPSARLPAAGHRSAPVPPRAAAVNAPLSTARRALNGHPPAGLADKTIDHRQPQTAAAAGLFGGKERFEHPALTSCDIPLP